MKTLKVIFVALFTLAFTQISFANNPNTSTVATNEMMLVRTMSTEDNAVTLRLARASETPVTIFLKQADGTVVFFEKTKGESTYLKCFRLEMLPDGNYYFSIQQKANPEITKDFNLTNGKVTLKSNEELFVVRPATEAEQMSVDYGNDQSIAVAYQNTGDTKLKFVVSNKEGDRFFASSIQPNENFSTVLKLTHLPDGMYFVKIEGNTKNNVQTINIKNGELTINKETPRA